MSNEQQNNSRRAALKTMFKGIGVLGLGGSVWGTSAIKLKASELTLRPPGAIEEENFVKACLRCGTCIEA